MNAAAAVTERSAPKALRLVSPTRSPAGCASCATRGLCWSADVEGANWVGALSFTRRRVKRGDALYRMGEEFEFLYAIRSGFFKTRVLLEDGRDHVTGFRMIGELLGFDGIGAQRHASDAIALEDSEVCAIDYERVLAMAHSKPQLARELQRLMSQEIVREQGVMALLGTMQADERVAAFLLSLSARMKARGYSPTCFVLRMTREEIGSYLGLKLETVSRVLGRLQGTGLVRIEHNKEVTLLDLTRLRGMVGELPPTGQEPRAAPLKVAHASA